MTTKISTLPSLATVTDATIIPVVEGGATKKITGLALKTYTGTASGPQGPSGPSGPSGAAGSNGASGPSGPSGPGTLNSGTAGYMPYYSGSTALSAATSGNLFWDNTNVRLGIGTTSPASTIHVVGDYPAFFWKNNIYDSPGLAIRHTRDGTGFTAFYVVFQRDNGTGLGSITGQNGSSISYNTSSDHRLKENPQPLLGSGVFIDALQPKTWNWKSDGSRGVGFIAHEVQTVSPSSVIGEKDAVDTEGNPVMQSMEYGSAEFIANIVAELQSLRARVAQLEAKG